LPLAAWNSASIASFDVPPTKLDSHSVASPPPTAISFDSQAKLSFADSVFGST